MISFYEFSELACGLLNLRLVRITLHPLNSLSLYIVLKSSFNSNCETFLFQIRDIQEDVDYYIDNCLEPDFTENDMIYDDIDGLEEMLLDVSF